MTRLLPLLLISGLMAGCGSSQVRMATEAAVDVGKALNDEALNAAEFTLCYGASVGSIRRKFGTPQRAEVWRNLCQTTDEFRP